MNHANQVMTALENLQQQVSELLQRMDIAAGTTASEQPEAGEVFSNRQLLERMDQLVLAASSPSMANTLEVVAREEIQSLAELLERNFAQVTESTNQNELLVSSWQEQLDRMEGRLEQLMESVPAPARFG